MQRSRATTPRWRLSVTVGNYEGGGLVSPTFADAFLQPCSVGEFWRRAPADWYYATVLSGAQWELFAQCGRLNTLHLCSHCAAFGQHLEGITIHDGRPGPLCASPVSFRLSRFAIGLHLALPTVCTTETLAQLINRPTQQRQQLKVS